jgi:carboxynorspermidine decarboxylase
MQFPTIPSPCFVIEEALLRRNLNTIKTLALAADVEFILAFKGFSTWGVFDIVREYISGATASSLHEAQLCNEHMKTKAHTYCVAIADDEIEAIASLSSHLTFNSLSQYNRFHAAALNHNCSIGLRINPQFSKAKTELYNPGSPVSRLGIDPSLLPDVLPDNVDGLHFHVLCENNSYDLEAVLNHVELHVGKHLHQLKWLNMGGGHLVTHQDYDTNHLIALLGKFKIKYPNLKIILEPGSAHAWQAGFLKSTVLDVVNNGGMATANLDVSFTAHMPDCLEMPYKPAIRGGVDVDNMVDKPKNNSYRLGGTSCLAGDYLTEYYFENELKTGDELIMEDMIHYTMVKTSTFNGVKHPSIGLINLNGEFKLIRTFGYDDFKNKLS